MTFNDSYSQREAKSKLFSYIGDRATSTENLEKIYKAIDTDISLKIVKTNTIDNDKKMERNLNIKNKPAKKINKEKTELNKGNVINVDLSDKRKYGFVEIPINDPKKIKPKPILSDHKKKNNWKTIKKKMKKLISN